MDSDPKLAPWQLAKATDVEETEIVKFVPETKSCSAADYADHIFGEAKKLDEGDRLLRVLNLVGHVLYMKLNADDPIKTYQPMIEFFGEGRSADISDFKGDPVEAIVRVMECTDNPVINARLGDVAWLLERNRHKAGLAALQACIEVIRLLDSGDLVGESDSGLIGFAGYNYLQRSLYLAKGLGRPQPEYNTLLEFLRRCSKLASQLENLNRYRRFVRLDLDWQATDPHVLAEHIISVLGSENKKCDNLLEADLWKLASRAYHIAKNEREKLYCQSKAAECYVSEAEKFEGTPGLAINAAHWIAESIQQYHGHPDANKRRQKLKKRLQKIQLAIPGEMQTISTKLDVSGVAQIVSERFEGKSLSHNLLLFADLERSPSPDRLLKDAKESAKSTPLSSLFESAHLDRAGRTIAKSPSLDFGEHAKEYTFSSEISNAEQIRRQVVVVSTLEVARRAIMSEHHISLETIWSLLFHSPAVPVDLRETVSTGFLRFFEGDFVSALYILTPMLEAIIRFLLISAGHDVSKFDDATGIQQERTITSIFDNLREELESTLGVNIVADIEQVFLSPTGPKTRHGVAHGLHNDGFAYSEDAFYAVWLLWRICCLPLFEFKDEIELR